MSIDFSTLQGLTIPEGVVTQIADASGNVLWALNTGFDGTFKVKKITATTYAGETSYANEKFIRLIIYPKTNGTVSVTYEGLTKTITDTSGAEEPNGRSVFFGTFHGVSDEVETPESGIVTITGDWYAAGIGTYQSSSKETSVGYCSCITDVGDLTGIEIVPINAFRGCNSIKSVVIPDGVSTIDDNAFYGCTNLTDITIPDSVTSLCNPDAVVPDGSVFYNCRSLINVNIPNGITTLPRYTFYCCTNLTHITIPNSVTSIMPSAFSGCTSLSDVAIPNSVQSIGVDAFSDCKSFKSVIIPSGVTEISGNPWVACFENNAITVASGNSNFKIDGNCLIDIKQNALVSGFADSVIPSYVTSMNNYAFKSCESLTSIVIPSNVTQIGVSAFYGCVNLTNVVMLATTPPTLLDTYAFYNTTCTFTVPAGCGEAYKAAEYWSEYADRIVEAS